MDGVSGRGCFNLMLADVILHPSRVYIINIALPQTYGEHCDVYQGTNLSRKGDKITKSSCTCMARS